MWSLCASPFLDDILGSDRSRSYYGLVVRIDLVLLCWVRNLGPQDKLSMRQKDKNKILPLQ